MGKREKTLEKARRSAKGWTSERLCRLYEMWGFERSSRSGHGGDLKYPHPKYPDLGQALVTKSSGEIHPFYVREAVRLIDDLIARGGT